MRAVAISKGVEGAFDRTKSLQELEQHNWGDPAPTDTPLVTRCLLLRRKPLAEFTVENLRTMIGQQIGLPHLMLFAVEVLEANPLAEGDFYPGDLLCAVLGVKEEFWSEHPDLMERMRPVVKQAEATLAAEQDETSEAVRKDIATAPRILRTAVPLDEEELSRMLRHLLQDLPDGADVSQSPNFMEFLQRSEWFIPGVIREIHPEFDYCFDGIEPRWASKIGDRAIEVRGAVWLLDDQCSLTPLHVRLQVAADEDRIWWLECRVGKRSRAESQDSVWKRLATLDAEDFDAIDWAYEVGFGQRR